MKGKEPESLLQPRLRRPTAALTVDLNRLLVRANGSKAVQAYYRAFFCKL